MLPYEDLEFKASIKSFLDDVVRESELSWTIPDYINSRVYFYITNNEIYLSIEVLPKHYSAKERQAMLQTASQEEMEDGWSEYLRLVNMFDDIDEILNCSDPVGEVGTYYIEMTKNENEALLSKNKWI